jgi:hypothetical protein
VPIVMVARAATRDSGDMFTSLLVGCGARRAP